MPPNAKPLHATHRLAYSGAVDADGHILEPPDLWETYLEPRYRDRALRIVVGDDGLEALEIGGRPSVMSRRGSVSVLGAMGDPDLGEAPYGLMDYTTIGLLWEAELETPAVYDEILYEVDDPVATITLHRPDALNAWTNRMGAEVRHAVGWPRPIRRSSASSSPGPRRAFCAGADMNLLSSITEGAAGADDVAGSSGADLTPAPLHAGHGRAERESRPLMVERFGRPDFTEGVQSFLQKRAPKSARLPASHG